MFELTGCPLLYSHQISFFHTFMHFEIHKYKSIHISMSQRGVFEQTVGAHTCRAHMKIS